MTTERIALVEFMTRLGKFGGLFYHNGLRPTDAILYCTRPGLRIWLADVDGSVHKTLLFKDILNKECHEVPIINPLSANLKSLKRPKEATFGKLLTFQEDLLVTYGSDVVYILNPKMLTVVSVISNLRGILDIATNKEEIFILEEDRSLIRIAYQPEQTCENNYSIPLANTFVPLSMSIREFTNKFQANNTVSITRPFEIRNDTCSEYMDMTAIVSAEEATESQFQDIPNTISSEIKLVDDINEKIRKAEIYQRISQEKFDDQILFKHHRSRRKSSQSTNIAESMITSTSSLSSNNSDEKDFSVSKATFMCMTNVMLPDLRSPESILCDIEEKEKILADILNFDKIKLSTECAAKDNADRGTVIMNGINENVQHLNETKFPEIKTDLACGSKVTSNQLIVGKKPTHNTDKESLLTVHQNTLRDHLKSEGFDTSPNKIIYENKIREVNMVSKTTKDSKIVQPPAVVNIPNDWHLSKLTTEQGNSTSDSSLGDWELV